MRVALAQINPTIGDMNGNADRVIRWIESAAKESADLVVFPELVIFGYPPKDLLLHQDLVQRNVAALHRVAEACTQTTAVVGYVQPDPERSGKGIYNAAAVCRNGRVVATYTKMLLPTYDVFDESRYFNAGQRVQTFNLSGPRSMSIGLTICEDLWNDHQFDGRHVYGIDPIQRSVDAGARVLVNLSASPFRVGKNKEREGIFSQQIRASGTPLVYVNQVGGNDDLVFDGASMVLDANGRVIARAKAFEEDLLIVDLAESKGHRVEPYPDRIDSVRKALVLGLRDYVSKCGFKTVVLGLSGGIDSAVTAAIAVEAMGADAVCGVALPSRFSSTHSMEDAKELAENLGIRMLTIPIESVHVAMESAMAQHFNGHPQNVAEENIQARIRGNILMALSNKFGWLLLTTGNKSELAVGYCTLYGDMCGGIAVLADVPKTVVYELARYINQQPTEPVRSTGRPIIPARSIDKPPSAELAENQFDQDSLPPYDTLDAILERYIERTLSPDQIVAEGFDRVLVERITKLVDRNEYKRKQAPVGLKVTSLAFGTGRRMPIAAKCR